MNKMPHLAETLTQGERRNFAATTTDAEMAFERGFNNTASYVDAGRAAEKSDTIVQYLERAGALCAEADALCHEDFTDLVNGIADLVSEAAHIRDRLREATR